MDFRHFAAANLYRPKKNSCAVFFVASPVPSKTARGASAAPRPVGGHPRRVSRSCAACGAILGDRRTRKGGEPRQPSRRTWAVPDPRRASRRLYGLKRPVGRSPLLGLSAAGLGASRVPAAFMARSCAARGANLGASPDMGRADPRRAACRLIANALGDWLYNTCAGGNFVPQLPQPTRHKSRKITHYGMAVACGAILGDSRNGKGANLGNQLPDMGGMAILCTSAAVRSRRLWHFAIFCEIQYLISA